MVWQSGLWCGRGPVLWQGACGVAEGSGVAEVLCCGRGPVLWQRGLCCGRRYCGVAGPFFQRLASVAAAPVEFFSVNFSS